uniref:Uncharacterized protein n=1 Tax=Syphacia muris TaxID=451379 RepID=A0A0N5AT72_9BILA
MTNQFQASLSDEQEILIGLSRIFNEQLAFKSLPVGKSSSIVTMNGAAVFQFIALLLLVLAQMSVAYNPEQAFRNRYTLRFRKDASYNVRPPFKGYIDPQYNPVIRFRRNQLQYAFNGIDNAVPEHTENLQQQYL